MAKKAKINLLYLIGMVVVLVGMFLPLTASKTFGMNGASAFDAITANGSGALKVGSILALIGAVAGLIFTFVNVKGVPLKLISLLVSVAGGLWVAISYMTQSDMAKGLAKFGHKVFGTKPSLGLFVIVIGWVVAIVAIVTSKDK